MATKFGISGLFRHLFVFVAFAVLFVPDFWSQQANAQGQTSPPSGTSPQTEEVEVTSQPSAVGATEASSVATGATSASSELELEYSRKLKSIEERVNSLKEKVFRSKARLLLLKETFQSGSMSGAKAVLYHVNELSASYSIESVTYFLDGAKIYSRADATGDLTKKEEIKIFEGTISPGNHQVTVNLMVRGNGFGVFSYLNSYKFKVTHSYNFIAEEGKVSRLRIIAYEKNGLKRDFKDRPNIRYDLVTDRNLPSASESVGPQ